MAETPLAIGADARCADGVCGKVTHVVVDPVKRAVTHLVVEPRHWPGLGRLVPIDLVDAATPKEVRLRCTRAEFDQLGFAEDTDFAPPTSLDQYSGYSAEQMLMLPYYSPIGGGDMPRTREDEPTGAYGSLPPGEVDVRRNERVYATDGEIGRVEGLVIESGSHHVSHVLLQEGHLLGRREVAIPIGAVTGVVDGVQLNITKQQAENLPLVDIDHPSG
ncbi:MAG: PRC-barrel domain-containing protein [Mycobacterium sp.]